MMLVEREILHSLRSFTPYPQSGGAPGGMTRHKSFLVFFVSFVEEKLCVPNWNYLNPS
jgi:hypothetical protein